MEGRNANMDLLDFVQACNTVSKDIYMPVLSAFSIIYNNLWNAFSISVRETTNHSIAIASGRFLRSFRAARSGVQVYDLNTWSTCSLYSRSFFVTQLWSPPMSCVQALFWRHRCVLFLHEDLSRQRTSFFRTMMPLNLDIVESTLHLLRWL